MADNNSLTPKGYHAITPLLKIKEPLKLIEFLKQVFEAKEINNIQQQKNEKRFDIKIGDSVIMISDSIKELESLPGSFYLYVNDVDQVYDTALKHGATSLRDPKNESHGERCAGIKDIFGNQWWIVSPNKKNTEEGTLGYTSDSYEETDQTFSI
jgi:PhnB protein